jgi:CMP-N-acetylneuraminate monooxygenase
VLQRLERLPVEFTQLTRVIELDVAALREGVNEYEDFVAVRLGGRVRVYDRVCDHNGGRLISRSGEMKCPLHGWTFDPIRGSYTNVECRKVPLLDEALGPGCETLSFNLGRRSRVLNEFGQTHAVTVRFLNHACLVVTTPTCKFALDPWIVGPAFCTGWSLAAPSPADSFEELNGCDFIYVSHNHPDHLHPQTLARVDKRIPILTPDFQSGSTRTYLEDLGFERIVALGFTEQAVDADAELSISILKSGDFRDDSGLLVQSGRFSALFAVDSNYIDFFRFPRELTLLCSSFAGGASGFPLCFDTYDEAEKMRILARNRNAVKATNNMMLSLGRPKYFLSYAGFFSEAAARDAYVRERNKKNKVSDYQQNCDRNGVALLNVLEHDEYRFEGGELVERRKTGAGPIADLPPEDYVRAQKSEYADFDRAFVRDYFENSGFSGDLHLIVSLTDDGFGEGGETFSVSFSGGGLPEVRFDEPVPDLAGLHDRLGRNVKHIRVRRDAFLRVIGERLPWEDMSIGFQCRIDRVPNVYNSAFWYHFTNVYVKSGVTRAMAGCGACETLQQSVF